MEQGFIYSFIQTFIEHLPYTRNCPGAGDRVPTLMMSAFWGVKEKEINKEMKPNTQGNSREH